MSWREIDEIIDQHSKEKHETESYLIFKKKLIKFLENEEKQSGEYDENIKYEDIKTKFLQMNFSQVQFLDMVHDFRKYDSSWIVNNLIAEHPETGNGILEYLVNSDDNLVNVGLIAKHPNAMQYVIVKAYFSGKYLAEHRVLEAGTLNQKSLDEIKKQTLQYLEQVEKTTPSNRPNDFDDHEIIETVTKDKIDQKLEELEKKYEELSIKFDAILDQNEKLKAENEALRAQLNSSSQTDASTSEEEFKYSDQRLTDTHNTSSANTQ